MKSLHSITLQSKSHTMDRGEVNKEKDAREEKLFENNTYAVWQTVTVSTALSKMTVYLKPLW